jgi:peptide-methionine (S)-S-oxide reductase
MKSIILGGGCFWCLEAIYQQVNGILKVNSGYMGGQVESPTYEQVCSGETGHAEVVKVDFDEKVISLEKILEIFWISHDPTTLNRQGNDVGTQYRSGIYWLEQKQKEIIENSIQTVAKKYWNDPIVTEVKEATQFYPAENYHQDYFNQHSWQPYCQLVINPKLKKLKEFLGKK